MAHTFPLTIASVSEVYYSGEAVSVSVPGSLGTLQILSGHEPLITTLVPGTIRYVGSDGTKGEVAIGGGIVEIAESRCAVLL